MAQIGPTTPTPPSGEQPGKAAGPTKPFDIGPPKNIPNNLGLLMKEYPKLGHEFYKALIIGIAMKIMQEARKSAQKFKQKE